MVDDFVDTAIDLRHTQHVPCVSATQLSFFQLPHRIPPSFGLHVFHHAIVLFMVFFWLETQQSLQFIGLLFNTFVHVVRSHRLATMHCSRECSS